jgi:hypothetical protein
VALPDAPPLFHLTFSGGLRVNTRKPVTAEEERDRVVRILKHHGKQAAGPKGYSEGGVNFTLNAIQMVLADVVEGVDYEKEESK